MRLEGTVRDEDASNYIETTTRRLMGWRGTWLPQITPVVVATSAIPLGPIIAQDVSINFLAALLVIGWAVGTLWTYTNRYIPQPKYFSADGAYLGPKTFLLLENSFRVESDGMSAEIDFHKIVDVVVHNGTVIILIDNCYGEVLPSNAFSNSREAIDFSEKLKALAGVTTPQSPERP